MKNNKVSNKLYKKQDKKFNNQVNHLQSFIGMPMWNGRNPSLSQIREYDRRLLEKQAMGFEIKRKNVLKRIFDYIVKGISRSLRRITKAAEKKEPTNVGSECCM